MLRRHHSMPQGLNLAPVIWTVLGLIVILLMVLLLAVPTLQ